MRAPLIAIEDLDYGTGSALDQRGVHEPVETIDALGVSPMLAVFQLNLELRKRGLPTYPYRDLSDETPDYMLESSRWCFVATHIVEEN